MTDLEKAFAAYQLTSIPLDDILAHAGITHWDFREFLAETTDQPMPAISAGLAAEVEGCAAPAKQLMRRYNLTSAECNAILRGAADNDDEVIRMRREAGEPVSELAVHYNISVPRVYQICSGIGRRKTRTTLSFEKKLELAKKHKRGASASSLAKEYKLTINTVYVYIREISLA